MMNALILYSTLRYGSILTKTITDMFSEELPYMNGCNLAIPFPQKFLDRSSVPAGLLSGIINGGFIIKEVP